MKLIINGDDYGLSESCSRAIAEALSKGLITHTTIMANGEYFDEAVRMAKARNFADKIGVHFNLTEGRPLTEAIKFVPGFVADGFFYKACLNNPRPFTDEEKSAIKEELSAQAEQILRCNIKLNHADSHHYIHTFLYLAPIVTEVCREKGISRIRLNRNFSAPGRPMITEGRIENSWWQEHGFVTTAHFGRLSDVEPGRVPDDTEIMVHPDYDKDGNLIDRTGISDGFPTGKRLFNPIQSGKFRV